MFRTLMRNLSPLPTSTLKNFDSNCIVKTVVIRRQQVSYSVSKVLHSQKKQTTLQSQDDAEDTNRLADDPTARVPSIVARKIYQDRIRAKGSEERPNLTQSADDLKNKLEDLSRQLKTFSSVSSEELSQLSSESANRQTDLNLTDNYDNEDHSVEQFIFKDDFLVQPKPSPLLGTEDPRIPASEIPCVGCGALLQCHNRVMPGFLPSENFKLMTERELKSSNCQRCHYIQHHNTFFSVSASPDSYAEMISKIKDVKSVVVMVVDVMDITGSIVPNLMDYIGNKHPILVVGNKADLLAPDCPEYLVNARKELRKACYNAGYSNIRKVLFVSAKTGFGVEKLVNLLFSYYKQRVDVFIVGTANAGKSSLFNTLLASDYCKHTARDLIQRATVSVWPGTTLNFLKFPIMRPSSHTINLRRKRLKQEEAMRKEMRKLKDERRKEKQPMWELKGEVNQTDVRTENQREKDDKGMAWGQEIAGYKGHEAGGIAGISLPSSLPERSSFEAENYPDSYWMYDTPGVINPDQTMNLLEQHESSCLSPVKMIIPRCVLLKPGTTVFACGLSRLDYVEGDDFLIATFHCSDLVPLRVVATEEADDFYEQNVGTEKLGIPLGDKVRLDKLPPLAMKEFKFVGESNHVAVADIQLSSVGWVSIAPKTGCQAKLCAFTPAGRGLRVRTPPLAANYTRFRGKRISGTPFFHTRPQGSAMINKTLAKD